MSKVLFEYHKPGGIVVRMTKTVYRGREELHVREWYPKGDTLAPSPKGTNFPWVNAPEFLKCLAAEIEGGDNPGDDD